MKRRCEELRGKAWRDGPQNRSYQVWRIHARSCPDCRTDLYLLETLQRQAVVERRHLGQTELSNLVRTASVQRSQVQQAPVAVVWGWSLRAFAFCAIVVLLATVAYRRGTGLNRLRVREAGDSSLARHVATSAVMPSAQNQARQLEANSSQLTPDEILSWPAGPPGGPIEKRLYRLRQRIEDHRDALLELLEHDVDERDGQDVWDVSLACVSALA